VATVLTVVAVVSLGCPCRLSLSRQHLLQLQQSLFAAHFHVYGKIPARQPEIAQLPRRRDTSQLVSPLPR
jgi:hypothetical protein